MHCWRLIIHCVSLHDVQNFVGTELIAEVDELEKECGDLTTESDFVTAVVV